MNVLSTGIAGLDKLVGGYPKGKSVLVTGKAGTGKTIMALHFVNACCETGMKCAYIATEESPEDLIAQGTELGWNINKYIKKGLLSIIEAYQRRAEEVEIAYPLRNSNQSEVDFFNLVNELPDNFDTIVIDNIGVFVVGMDIKNFRDNIDYLMYKLKEKETTAIIIIDEGAGDIFNEIATYSAHGAIKLLKLENPYTGKRERRFDFIKMRNSKIPTDYILYDITNNGIVLPDR
jgi:KaiC/GvpD/RAD55 family RecA-like ATPase